MIICNWCEKPIIEGEEFVSWVVMGFTGEGSGTFYRHKSKCFRDEILIENTKTNNLLTKILNTKQS